MHTMQNWDTNPLYGHQKMEDALEVSSCHPRHSLAHLKLLRALPRLKTPTRTRWRLLRTATTRISTQPLCILFRETLYSADALAIRAFPRIDPGQGVSVCFRPGTAVMA